MLLALILALCLAAPVCAQSLAVQRFEVASIRPSKADPSHGSGIRTGHGRLDGENVSLKRCIIGAYGVGPYQILGGPDWLDSDRFDISAVADPAAKADSDQALMLMLQDLLADRFKLALRRETRSLSAYVLEVARNGSKLEKAAGGESRTHTNGNNARISIQAENTTMEGFAKVLAREMDRPVVNQTRLEGLFNLKLQWARESAGITDLPSIFTALEEQLGLRLRSGKTPVEVLVIEHAEEPSEN
jgi:uncharacterized protein (TIGR03435 family)